MPCLGRRKQDTGRRAEGGRQVDQAGQHVTLTATLHGLNVHHNNGRARAPLYTCAIKLIKQSIPWSRRKILPLLSGVAFVVRELWSSVELCHLLNNHLLGGFKNESLTWPLT